MYSGSIYLLQYDTALPWTSFRAASSRRPYVTISAEFARDDACEDAYSSFDLTDLNLPLGCDEGLVDEGTARETSGSNLVSLPYPSLLDLTDIKKQISRLEEVISSW